MTMRPAFPGTNEYLDHNKGLIAAQWRGTLPLAIGLHLVVLAAAMILPTLVPRRSHLPEIYTVDLFQVGEISPQPVQAPTPPPLPTANPPAKIIPQAIKQPVAKPVPVAKPPAAAAPPKAISLEPLKRKIKLADQAKQRQAEKLKNIRALARLRADQDAKQAKAEAKQAAKDALSTLRQSLLTSTTASHPGVVDTPRPASSASTSGVVAKAGSDMSDVTKQYYAAAMGKIQQYWVLPALQNWDNDSLEAILVARIRRDGTVEKSFFESKSSNKYFNEFVMKTMREAAPLPPFPNELKQDSIEFGFVFHPGNLL